METILARIETRLDGMSKKLERLEVQNEILRKELHGIRSSPTHQDSFALMEAKTLREVVEDIQFQVKTINEKLTEIEWHQQEDDEIPQKESNPSSTVADAEEMEESSDEELDDEYQGVKMERKTINEKLADFEWHQQEDDEIPQKGSNPSSTVANTEEMEDSSDEEFDDEYQIVKIERKTWKDEQKWLKKKFNELRTKYVVEDGASFEGKNLETISNSIPLPNQDRTSCVLKLTNHLNTALTDAKFYPGWCRTEMTGPSVIAGHFSEVFRGSSLQNECGFWCSFSINSTTLLIVRCYNDTTGHTGFYIKFIPNHVGRRINTQDINDDEDGWPEDLRKPGELFVTTGQFLCKGLVEEKNNRAVFQVEILEMTDEPPRGPVSFMFKNLAPNLQRTLDKMSRKMKRSEDLYYSEGMKITCSVEIYNLLNVKLRNRKAYFSNGYRKKVNLWEVLPCQGVTFYSSDNCHLTEVFSYQIEWTDLFLVVGYEVGGKNNRFVGALLTLPDPMLEEDIKVFLDDNHCKSIKWRVRGEAKNGEQVLESRNIRAVISMSEGEKSVLKIHVIAF